MKQLALLLLRLLLQLVLFAITGRWMELGRDARAPSGSVRKNQGKKQGAARPARTFAAERKPVRARPSGAPLGSPLRAEEGAYRNPRYAVLEGGPVHALRAGTGRSVSGRRAPTSLRAALSNPRVVRDALVMDAALGAASDARRRRR